MQGRYRTEGDCMKLKLLLACAGIVTLSSCQTFNSTNTNDGDTFGSFDNVTIKNADLSPQEKMSLVSSQKQVYETAQRILENHYLDAWFSDYQTKNKFASLDEAKRDYFAKNTQVNDAEVTQFIKENSTNQELMQIPEAQRIPTVKQYLKRVAEAHAEQAILAEAYKQNKIKLIAFTKPQEPVVNFEDGGHLFDPLNKNPKVTIVEFADYQCPFCVKANPEIMKFVSAYKGQVQYIFRDFPLLDKHPQALPAAVAAKCAANQGKYWEMHSLIFDRAPMAELNANMYTNFAQKLKLDLTKFKDCQNDPVQRESVEADLNEGLRVGVNETPTVYINGQKFDDYISFDNLKNNVDKLMTR